VLDTFFLLSLPTALAQDGNAQCANAVRSAKNQIQRTGNVTIKVRKNNLPQEYQNYPKNRPYGYDFILSGTAVNSVMKSKKLFTEISIDVIKNCPSVGIVLVGQDMSDYSYIFGFLDENKVVLFQCVNPRDKRGRQWGYLTCAP
jgi:hypothetical protein